MDGCDQLDHLDGCANLSHLDQIQRVKSKKKKPLAFSSPRMILIQAVERENRIGNLPWLNQRIPTLVGTMVKSKTPVLGGSIRRRPFFAGSH